MRHCRVCGKTGHNAATCGRQRKINPQVATTSIEPTSQATPPEQSTLAEETPGWLYSAPRRGLWIVNQHKKKVQGKISHIKSSGEVVWEDKFGCQVMMQPDKIKESGYSFVDLTAPMLLWVN